MKLNDVVRAGRAPTGLAGLEGVPLTYDLQRSLDAAAAESAGSPAWRHRKNAEARELLALSRLAPKRMQVEYLDLTESLRALIRLRAPVPTRPSGSNRLEIESAALLGLHYPQQALLTPQPGAAFFQILEPRDVFLAQVPQEPPYTLCLAPVLPLGIPCRELVLMAYAALTLQSFQIDAAHPAGVFNAEAARWWQNNTARIPLTREAFL